MIKKRILRILLRDLIPIARLGLAKVTVITSKIIRDTSIKVLSFCKICLPDLYKHVRSNDVSRCVSRVAKVDDSVLWNIYEIRGLTRSRRDQRATGSKIDTPKVAANFPRSVTLGAYSADHRAIIDVVLNCILCCRKILRYVKAEQMR